MNRVRRKPSAAPKRAGSSGWSQAWLAAFLGFAAFAGCFVDSRGKEQPTMIDDSWTWNRRSPGHEAHLAAELECKDCHEFGDDEIGKPSADVCQRCHDAELLHHGKGNEFGPHQASDCTGCHRFASPKAPEGSHPLGLGGASGFAAPDDCLSCHDSEQGSHPAVVVHADQPCLDCHQPHDAAPLSAKTCTTCHDGVHLAHGRNSSDGRPQHEQCLDCHRPHGPAKLAGQACPTCHFTREPLIPATATFAGGHESCSSCHDSHDLRAAASQSCENCHGDHRALSAASVRAHSKCTSCHDQHDVKQAAHDACARCHTDAHTDHPSTRGALGPCVTCHVPHPDAAGRSKARPEPCQSCHSEPHAKKGHGGKDLACTECHEPHAFVKSVAEPSLCKDCHAEEVQGTSHNQGHARCVDCHRGLPHHPEDASTKCEACHQNEHAALGRHAECTSCHAPHSGQLARGCESCHQNEHRTAPKGHQSCTNCHDVHTTAPRQVQKTCANCHAAQAQHNPHTKLPGACANCHRPHAAALGKSVAGLAGPAHPPACASCHQPAKLPSLHATSGHQNCTSCHDAHEGTGRRDRATCTSCHAAQKEHQPGAQNCASCHLFVAAQ